MADWISVKDRLPEESGDYIVYSKSGYMTVWSYSKRYRRFNVYDDNDEKEATKYALECTHWMPLPEAPKEDDEDE